MEDSTIEVELKTMEYNAAVPIVGSPIGTAALSTVVFNSTSMVESGLFVRGNNNELSPRSFLNLVARLAIRVSS
jgi:hypothetical protein